MTFAIEYRPLAQDDLDQLRIWIEQQAGVDIAARYVVRIRRRIAALEAFPHRGSSRDDILPGSRSILFEGRVLVLYAVTADTIVVLRVVNAVRDLSVLR